MRGGRGGEGACGGGPEAHAQFGPLCTSQKGPSPPGRATEEERQRERPGREQNQIFLVPGIAYTSWGAIGPALPQLIRHYAPFLFSGHCAKVAPTCSAHPGTESRGERRRREGKGQAVRAAAAST